MNDFKRKIQREIIEILESILKDMKKRYILEAPGPGSCENKKNPVIPEPESEVPQDS